MSGVKGRYRYWYSTEHDDGRDMDTIKAYLNLGIDKIERRYNITVKKRRIYRQRGTDISPITARRMYWVMEGVSWERKEI